MKVIKQYESIFIADIHLSETTPSITALFRKFLQTQACHSRQLYLLGDIFDYWIGDDVMSAFHQEIAADLNTLSQNNVDIFVMVGNRDFLLGQEFCQQAGATLIPDPSLIDLGEHRVLLKHGDDLCAKDTRHQLYRRISRISLIKRLFLTLPKKWRLSIAERIRHASQKHNKIKPKYLLDSCNATIISQISYHQADILIHGHTHNPQITHLNCQKSAKQCLVLSDWHETSLVLCYHLTKGFYFKQVN